jgi:hypothetical protein
MGFFKSQKGSVISDFFLLKKDVGQLKAENMVDMALFNDHLELSAPMSKTPITLNYSQITDVYYGLETEITQKNKSVIGRAIAGGLLFGGAGMVVGSVSGVGTKDKKTIKRVFIISYTGSSGNNDFLQFEDTRAYKGQKLANKLKEMCKIGENVVTSL